jgi:hypothetical protein
MSSKTISKSDILRTVINGVCSVIHAITKNKNRIGIPKN